MAKNGKRASAGADAVDLARRVMLRATDDLRIDASDDAHVQAKEYARSAAAAGRFQGRPASAQDATTRNHLASRFERRLETLLDAIRRMEEAGLDASITMLRTDPDPVFLDAGDLKVLDGGLRIVIPDRDLFDRLVVRDLRLPPDEPETHVRLDVLRTDKGILVVAYALANAVYGMGGIHLDDQGAIVRLMNPTGIHDATPLDGDNLERVWTIIGAAARQHGRTMSRSLKAKARAADQLATEDATEETQDEVETVWERLAAAPDAEPDENGFLPAVLPGAPPFSEVVRPIADAPFDDAAFDAYARHMEVNAATRILLEVFAPALVRGRLPERPGQDLVTRMFLDSHAKALAETIDKGRRKVERHGVSSNDPGFQEIVEEIREEATAEALADADEQGIQYNALLRLLAMHARERGPITTSTSCNGNGDQTLTSDTPFTGIVVIKDRTLFDIVRDHEADDAREPAIRREVPFTVLYRILPVGVYGVIHQMDARHTNILRYFAMATDASPDEESELEWALRNVLAPAIDAYREAAAVRHAELEAAEGGRDPVAVADAGVGATVAAESAEAPVEVTPARIYTHGLPTDRPLQRLSQVSLEVADYAVATRVIDEWFDRTSDARGAALMLDRRSHSEGWRLEHASEDDAHVWAVSVRAGSGPRPRLEIILESTDRRARSSMPGIVRQIADATPTCDLDGVIALDPPHISTRPQMRELMSTLTDPDRRMPMLVLTSDERGEYMMTPRKAAEMCAGALRVVTVDGDMTREMRDSWGQPYTVFNGASRIYQPGFDPVKSNALAHQRFMPGSVDTLRFAINREIAATVRRYHIENNLVDDLAEVAKSVAATRAEAVTETAAVREAQGFLPTAATAPEPVQQPARDKTTPPAAVAPTEEGAPDDVGQEAVEADVETPASTGMPASVVEATAPPAEGPMDAAVEEQLDLGVTDEVLEEQAELQLEVDRTSPPAPAGLPTHPSAVRTPEEVPGDIEGLVARLIEAALVDPLHRLAVVEQHIERVEEERDTARAQLSAVQERAVERARRDQQILEDRENENDELLRIAEQERDQAIAQRREAIADRDEALDLVTSLTADLARLRAEMRKAGIEAPPAEENRPTRMADVGHWANERFPGRLLVHQRTMKTLRKTNYDDVDKVVALVELLAGDYVDARRSVDGAHARFQEGIARLHVDDTPHDERGGPESGQSTVVVGKRKLLLDRHLKAKGTGKRERGALRIYFTYDDETQQVVIGWMPDHLTTATT
jgi:hypothetical protein